MIILPAIDLLDGKCVQLEGGDPSKKIFEGDALEQARKWVSLGAEKLWIVDLNGALDTGNNTELIAQLIEEVNIPVFVAGGIRTEARARELLDAGVEKICIGTMAVENPEFINQFDPERVIVALDCKDGKVCVRGWTKTTDQAPVDIGAKYYLVTNVNVEGKQQGPDFKFMELMVQTLPNVILSGGISSIEDVKRAKELNPYGLVIGSALYSGKLDFKEVLNA